MQRLFPGFPSALPGVGLLVLRLVLAAGLLADGASRLAAATGPDLVTVSTQLGLALIGLGILGALGLLSPIMQTATALLLLAQLAVALTSTGLGQLFNAAAYGQLLETAIAACIALLGPGAYSVDRVLFGRHELVIPPVALAQPSHRPSRKW